MRTASLGIALFAAMVMLASAPAFARGFIQSPELLDRIKPGLTTAQEAEQILGPPATRGKFPKLGLVSMDYFMRVWADTVDVSIMVGEDGVVREVQKMVRYKGGA